MSAMPSAQPPPPPPSNLETADQHTYQNHRPNFPVNPAGPGPNNRSTSVGNLTMPRPGPSGGQGGPVPQPGGGAPLNGVRFPSQPDIAGFDQGYYQNVGGGHNGQLQQHMPLR